jgi:hypothetical protein
MIVNKHKVALDFLQNLYNPEALTPYSPQQLWQQQ